MAPSPKGKGEFGRIRIVDVTWRVFEAVVNCHLKPCVELHDTLHGFREGQGTGTATLEANLEHNLARIAHNPLLQDFLEACKAYD